MAHVELNRITKIYHDPGNRSNFQALSGIDLVVESGEFITIMGPSGAGKSTLLNILGGNILPSSGEIHVDGAAIHGLSPTELMQYRRSRCGFLWQESEQNLLQDLTVEQNLKQVMRVAGYRGNRKKRISELLDRLQMGHRRHHPVRKLSGGEALRVSLAVAIVNSPPLLILDEPVAELDSATASEVISYLSELNRGGTTIIVSTHSRLFNTVTDRIYRLLDGMIVGILPKGTDDEVLKMNNLGQLRIPSKLRRSFDSKFIRVTEEEGSLRLESYEE